MACMWPKGLKRTKQREAVLTALEEAEKPLSAFEIFGRLPQDGGFAVSTVYRVLTAFEEAGTVSKTTLLGDDTALYHLKRGGHEHFAVCLGCHRQVALAHCPLEREVLEADGFQVTGHRLELYGYCADCTKRRDHGKKTAD